MKPTKKMLSISLVLMLAFSSLTVMASPANEITVTIDGVAVDFDGQGPIIVDNRTLVPVRGVFEALGFYPTWDRATQTATLTRDDFVVVLTIGSATFTTNGREHSLDVPAQLIGGRVLLPLRAVLQSVGYDDMDWERATRTVVIRTETESQLVGTWAWEALTSWQYTFNENGTGTRGQNIRFNWNARNGILSMCATPDKCGAICMSPEQWYYEIEDDYLTLTSRDAHAFSYTYIMVEPEPEPTPRPTPGPLDENLVGTWAMNEEDYDTEPFLVFRPDGMGYLYFNEIEWTTTDGMLSLCFAFDLWFDECWDIHDYIYLIDGDYLFIYYPDLYPYYPYEFIRLSTTYDTPIPTPTPTPVAHHVGHELLGGWTLNDEPFLEFWDNGRGLLKGNEIGWFTISGWLEICTTPDECQGNCWSPESWFYIVEDDQLILTGSRLRAIYIVLDRQR